jgi:hypothetical protein
VNGEREPRDCPYVGLDPFREEYRPFFFGRERDSRIIADSVSARQITVLYGASGVGKSSVLNVGLPAELRSRDPDWIIATQRDWQNRNRIAARLVRALRGALRSALRPQARLPIPLDAALKASRRPILLILDQFEEYFLYETRAVVTAAEKAFGTLISRRDLDLHVLIAVRDDSLHLLNKLRAVIPFGLETTIQLRHLSDEGAKSAIRGPIQKYNEEYRKEIEFKDDLVEAVIDQLRESASRPASQGIGTAPAEIELPYLQLTLTKLWDKAGGPKATALSIDTLEDLGGVQKIARDHVEKILGGLEPKEKRALCADMFRYLVTGSGGKIAYRTDDLATQVTNDRRRDHAGAEPVSTEEVGDVLEELSHGEKRLMRPVKALTVYELFHDVLGLPILDWRQKFLDDRARQDAERERQAKEEAQQAAQEAIADATKAAEEKAAAEEQLRVEAQQKALAETKAREAADQKTLAEQQAREAAEKATAAERQAREAADSAASAQEARAKAEQAARVQAQTSARRLGVALFFVAVAGLAALGGFWQASQQGMRAQQSADEARIQLDRANHAIARAIDSDLVFQPRAPFEPRTRTALWKLARADSRVRRDYVAILTPNPRELARAAPGFLQISRSLGVLWPPADEAERLVASAVTALISEEVEAGSVVAVIKTVSPKLTAEQANKSLDLVLKKIAQTTDTSAIWRLAQAIQALPVKLTDAQADQALDPILNLLGRTTNPRTLPELTRAIQALATKLSGPPVGRVLDRILEEFARTTDPLNFPLLAQTIQALSPKLTDAQAVETLETILKGFRQTTDPFALRALAQAIQALPVKLTDAQAGQAIEPILKQFAQTTSPRALQELARAIQSLAPTLTDAQASLAFDPLLKQIGNTAFQPALQALARAIQALAPKLTEAQASQVLGPILKQFAQTTDSVTLRAFVATIQALAPKLTDAQAQAALDLLLKEIGQTKPSDAQPQTKQDPASSDARQAAIARALAQSLQALASKLTEAQAQAALEPILKQISDTTSADSSLQVPAQTLSALAPKLNDAQAGQALDAVLTQLGGWSYLSDDALTALAQALTALVPKLNDAQVGKALDPVVDQIARGTTSFALQAFAQALTALAPKLIEAKAQEASEQAKASLAWAASEEEAADWARALVALLDRARDPQRTQKLAASVAFPPAAGKATEVLIDAIRTPDAPAKEAGTNAALEWLAKQYPDVLRPPVCPPPPQNFEVSGLKCPDEEAQADQ